jgi:hypothetical protein
MYQCEIESWMELVRVQCEQFPVPRSRREGNIGFSTLVSQGQISELLTGSFDKYGGQSATVTWQWDIDGIEDLEGMLVSGLVQANDLRPFLFLVQLWLVAATRLGFANFLRPILIRFDVLVNAAEWNLQCIPASHILDVYNEKAARHLYMEDCRVELTRAILHARAHHLGTQRADVNTCGMHPADECPEPEGEGVGWQDRSCLDPAVNQRSLTCPPSRVRRHYLNAVLC